MHGFALGFGFLLLLSIDCFGQTVHLMLQSALYCGLMIRSSVWNCCHAGCPMVSVQCQQAIERLGQPCEWCLPDASPHVTSARIFGWRKRARTRTSSMNAASDIAQEIDCLNASGPVKEANPPQANLWHDEAAGLDSTSSNAESNASGPALVEQFVF